MIKARILCLCVVFVVAAGCGGRRGDPQVGTCPPCRAPDAGQAFTPPRADGGAAVPGDAGAPSGRRLQHFTLLGAAKGYRSRAACVAQVAATLPPELTREADRANLAERVCQTRRALFEKSVSLCEDIQDPLWPAACRRLYAGLYGAPQACPVLSPRSRGREPGCVALATRDPALCRAVPSDTGRMRCRALLGPASLCRALRTSAEVASCHRDRRRWRAVLRPAKPSLGPKWTPGLEVAITVDGKTQKGTLKGLERGVVMPSGTRKPRLLLGALRPTGRLSAFEKRIRISFDVANGGSQRVGAGSAASDTLTRVCLLYEGRPVAPAQIRGKHEMHKVEARRGAEVAGNFTASFKLDQKQVRIDVSYRTFVRDLVPYAWGRANCAGQLEEIAPPPAKTGEPAARPRPEEGRPCYFVAHWEGLTQVGYRAYGVRRRGACARLGLRDGDVVTSQRGQPLKRWADVDALYRALADPKPLLITVRRGKRRLTLKR